MEWSSAPEGVDADRLPCAMVSDLGFDGWMADFGEWLPVDSVLHDFGRVDVLVHNAFAIPPMEPLTTLDEDALRTSNETNVLAPLRLTRLLADALAESQGSVVFVNSAVVHHSRVEFGGYKLAKGALLHMASSLATELGPRGVRVNGLLPGRIDTGGASLRVRTGRRPGVPVRGGVTRPRRPAATTTGVFDRKDDQHKCRNPVHLH